MGVCLWELIEILRWRKSEGSGYSSKTYKTLDGSKFSFKIFEAIYRTEEGNVSLVFDILGGLPLGQLLQLFGVTQLKCPFSHRKRLLTIVLVVPFC